VIDPRPSWAVPLSWEVSAKALGGRREALIRWGMCTDAISKTEDLQISWIPSDKPARGLGKLFCTERAPLANLLGNTQQEETTASWGGGEKYHKRLENIGDNAGGQCTVAWVTPPTCMTKIQQKRTCLQIPAQSHLF
jgi:hypothetical protein